MDEDRDVGESTAPRAPPRVRKPKDVAPKISRPRPPRAGNEEAGEVLNLGEFQDVDTLTLSEASLVINAILEKRKETRRNTNETEMLQQTLTYLDNFARFNRNETVESVERLLSSCTWVAKFERAQLGSLCCEAAEEAKTLIPSLADKVSDEDLQQVLDEISNLQGK